VSRVIFRLDNGLAGSAYLKPIYRSWWAGGSDDEVITHPPVFLGFSKLKRASKLKRGE
jgi:hypothetical protein